ncbi:transglutaminase domain-containing protein [Botrimarina sp.]|uniref:transglutaminase-like domain-containing protein n=1 Tax=Botrimarina sp. TaxID=2795802 RepID=UPI0032F0486B
MTAIVRYLVGLSLVVLLGTPAAGDDDSVVDSLIKNGQYAQAEALLRSRITDPDAPVVGGPARRLEVLRRTRRDFPLTATQVLEDIRDSLPDAMADDIRAWTASGDLQHRTIDGQPRYFRRAASNLFRLNTEAKRRRDAHRAAAGKPPEKKFDLVGLAERVLQAAGDEGQPLVMPVRHRVTYTLSVKPSCQSLRPGAVVRAWLPFPQAYRQQGEVRLLGSRPEPTVIAPNGSPHRTVYYELVLDNGEAPSFRLEFEFVTKAYCPNLNAGRVGPYDTGSDEYRRFTAEREPHIVFTPEVRRLVKEIVGDETNPLEKARLIFHWVSANLPWVGEMEYSIIPSLSAKGIATRCGDCGVQGMTFITLCRAAGVPARWQSGFGTKPGEEGMHDWSEFYVEPWGWLPADASYGVLESKDPRVRDFFCGRMDPYRLIVNLDYARPLVPEKTSFRSEPNDFQRGEVEIGGANLYFDDWTYDLRVEAPRRAIRVRPRVGAPPGLLP